MSEINSPTDSCLADFITRTDAEEQLRADLDQAVARGKRYREMQKVIAGYVERNGVLPLAEHVAAQTFMVMTDLLVEVRGMRGDLADMNAYLRDGEGK